MNIGGMNTFLGMNDLGKKYNGTKRYLAANDEILAIEKKLASGIAVDDLTEEEYKKLNAYEKAEGAAFWCEANESMSQAERIAIKIAKGEQLTPEEERLIDEKYPDLKREAQQARQEAEELKKRMQSAKTREEKQQIAANAMQSISSLVSKGTLTPIQATIKLAATQKAIEEAEKENQKNGGLMEPVRVQAKVEPGSFLNVKI